jgi:hypothetical protein
MHARAPLDVDLEDKLLYGLTPIRLAYLVVGLLAAFAIWSSPWAPSPLRVVTATAVVVLGVAVAWGRWRGRAADSWVADISIFALNTYRVSWDIRWRTRLRRRAQRAQPTPPQTLDGHVLVLSLRAVESGRLRPASRDT